MALADIAIASTGTPYIVTYPWTSGSGFGAKYSNPSTLPGADGRGCAFTASGADIGVGSITTPFIQVYGWTVGTGFGSKYSNPGTLPPNQVLGIAFTSTGVDVAVSVAGTSPFVTAYPFTSGTGFGTKYSNPGTPPTSDGDGISFNGTSDVAIAHVSSPFVTAYPWTPGTGFGSKYSNPATLPASDGNGIFYRTGGTDVAVAHVTSPRESVYPWSAGFGAKYANPATLPAGNGEGTAFSPSGTDLAVAHLTTPFVSAYPWSSGFGTKYSDPGTVPTNNAFSVGWEVGGADLAVGHNTPPWVSAYPWSSGFGTKYSDPGTSVGGIGRSISFAAITKLTINVSDALTIGETVAVDELEFVGVSNESMTVGDVPVIFVPFIGMSVFDSVTIGESVSFEEFESFSVQDALVLGELSVLELLIQLDVIFDDLTVNELIHVHKRTSGAGGAVPLLFGSYLDDFAVGDAVSFQWDTFDGVGNSVDPTTVGVIQIYRTNADLSTWEIPRASSNGIQYFNGFAGNVGLNALRIDLADDSDPGFYAAGGEYQVVIVGMVTDDRLFNGCLFTFSIERTSAVLALLKTNIPFVVV